ncbi:sugar ABC transporter ATP-binding protein [Ruminococcus gauvreauii]|uniref:Sugar ABC transporter ATP-binding protein n=1 Tax=Ruminococcus gauvreauii TaxID=438033 RepID=A0ABY5VKF7_9FIRM|nr:sugar ABC transporter ATP-binding protein [Ruminococcus gauvreauii]UWP61035.1 sugar ABC transporter ATP-binding protein [Ruminococcus gauvreauii]
MEQKVMLSVQHITKRFGTVTALDDVSFDIYEGQVHGLVGENGAGKSTLMKILSGVHKKDEGKVFFDGKEMNIKRPLDSLELGLSIIYQEFNLIESMSVGENIFLNRFREVGGMKKTHREARALLDSIGSTIDTHTPVEDLSVSEKQMVEICKALSFHSKLIIMDEPSTTLTNEEMKRLISIINDLRSKGITIIYISHKLDEIFELCDRVTIMRDGHVIDTRNTSEMNRADMIAKMVGRTIENEYPPRAQKVGETILEVRNLNTKKLHDISFTARRGEILGLVGLVGAGRTETVRAIFGADKLHSGEVWLEGKKLDIKSPLDAKNHGFGFVPEERKGQGLLLNFDIATNISMAAFDHFTDKGVLNKKKEKEIVEKQIKALGVKTPGADERIGNLSGGNQQKCLIARWLELNPKVLIMDEPTRGIDVGAKYEIYVLMKEIAEAGGTIIMISSELPEVLNMSNRVYVLCDGHVAGEFDAAEVTDTQVMAVALGEEGTK